VQAALSMANHRIDVLILNAGVYQLEPALSTSMETTQYLLRVNFESPVALATQVIRQDDWKSRGSGQIVAVTSLVARGPQSLTSSYAASKAALWNYLFTLSTEEAEWLQVNVALPGATRTNLWDSLDTGTTNTNNAKANKRARDEVKMSPQRVAQLILTGAAGPSLLFYEMFITKPIGLVWVYLSLYTPNLFHILVHVIGYIRVQLWNQTGSDTLDVPTLLKSTIDMLMRRL
jgi:short-subunit dehydrogenase